MPKELKRITDEVVPPPEELETSFLVGSLFTVSEAIPLPDERLPSVRPGVYMLLGGELGRKWQMYLEEERYCHQIKGRTEDKVYFDFLLTFPRPGVKKVFGMYRCTFRHYIELGVITKGVEKYAQMVIEAKFPRKMAQIEPFIVDYPDRVAPYFKKDCEVTRKMYEKYFKLAMKRIETT